MHPITSAARSTALIARTALLLGGLCGCAMKDRAGGVTFAARDPAQLSEVVPGKLYRSAQPTAFGLQKAIADHGIRTVINLRGEEPDPDLGDGQRERAFCAAHAVRYVHLGVHPERDKLFPTKRHPDRPLPPFIQEFLATTDDPASGPVLIHCAGGKHRTGLLVGSYRIAKEGWSAAEAAAEMMAYGFEPKNFRENPHIMPYLEHLAASSATGANHSDESPAPLAHARPAPAPTKHQ